MDESILDIGIISELVNCEQLSVCCDNVFNLSGCQIQIKNMISITHLSISNVENLRAEFFESLKYLLCLQKLRIGKCTNLPEHFGSKVLNQLFDIVCLRIECCENAESITDIVQVLPNMPNIKELQFISVIIPSQFDIIIAKCTNIPKMVIIPSYIKQAAIINRMLLVGLCVLNQSLTHLTWGISHELIRVTELFWHGNNKMCTKKSINAIPVLKPVPYDGLNLNSVAQFNSAIEASISVDSIEILSITSLSRILTVSLPCTRIKIVRMPSSKMCKYKSVF